MVSGEWCKENSIYPLICASLFQKIFNIFDVVEGVIDEEGKFRYDAQLIFYALPQFEAYLFSIGTDQLQCSLLVFAWEYAKEGLGKAEIGANPYAGNGNHLSKK